MPSVSPDEVLRLASLARIEVTPEEAERLAADLGDILTHVATLEAAEEAPVSYAAPERSVFRIDGNGEQLGARAREAFPEAEGDFLKVPRVF